MCLAIPGKVIEVREDEAAVGGRLGLVDFHGSRVEVSLAMVPEAALGSWVLVHAGFAIEVLDEAEAAETWDWLDQAGLVEEVPPELQGRATSLASAETATAPSAATEPATTSSASAEPATAPSAATEAQQVKDGA